MANTPVRPTKHHQLTRDRIAKAERELAMRPLIITGLSAEERTALSDRIWYTEAKKNLVVTTMNVLPLAAAELCTLRGTSRVVLSYVRGRYYLASDATPAVPVEDEVDEAV